VERRLDRTKGKVDIQYQFSLLKKWISKLKKSRESPPNPP